MRASNRSKFDAAGLILSSKQRSAILSSCAARFRPKVDFAPDLSKSPQATENLLPQTTDLLQTYRGLVTLGKIRYDEAQIRVVMQLRRLQKDLAEYAPSALTSHYLTLHKNVEQRALQPWWTDTGAPGDSLSDMKALTKVKSHAEELASLDSPKGLLLTGSPGSGKSFLIDLWFGALPTPFKARKHYNELVLEIYRGVWVETQRRMASAHRTATVESPTPSRPWSRAIRDQWRELLATKALPIKWARKPSMALSSSLSHPEPTIAFAVAQRLILRHWLLVFDEVQLLDVSSATLLADVLSWFWRMGGVIVGSSNKVPDDLYKNGVQRERLEPFVEALKARCPVVDMRSAQDWRKVRASDGIGSTWFTFEQKEAFEQKLDKRCTPAEGRTHTLTVFGRSLNVPWSSGGVCKFTFSELCDESLGPADYLSLASTYHTVAITSIPILKLSEKDQARRFISLIDALYEARCKVICLAESEPQKLFFPDASSAFGRSDIDVMMAEAVAETRDIYRPNTASYDAPGMTDAPSTPASSIALDKLSIFSGKDEQFAFKRALSRLLEMTSASYGREETWSPLSPSARKWERASSPADGTSSPPSFPRHPEQQSSPNPELHGTKYSESSDVASEAAHVDYGNIQRPEAPRLHENHVWGVLEDWGDRAKLWGRGARAYRQGSTPSSTRPRGH